jgi:hypothetical protein
MYLAELLLRKDFLKSKINKLKVILTKSFRNDMNQSELSYLRSLLDNYYNEYQRYLMKLERVNTQVEVTIGKSKLSLSDAIKIRDTLENKIEDITEMISAGAEYVDLNSFFEQKDQLFEEYMVLVRTIDLADWGTEID